MNTNLSHSTDLSKYMLDVEEAELWHDGLGNSYFSCKCYVDGNDHPNHIMADISWEAVEAAADIEDFPTWYWLNQQTSDLHEYCAVAINKAQGRTVNYRGDALPDIEPAIIRMDSAMSQIDALAILFKTINSPKKAV